MLLVLCEGIEPPSAPCKSAALPLDERSIIGCGVLESNQVSSAYETDEMPFLQPAITIGAAEGNRTLLHLLDRERLSQRATTAVYGAGRESRTPRSSAWKAAGGPFTCLPAFNWLCSLESNQALYCLTDSRSHLACSSTINFWQ